MDYSTLTLSQLATVIRKDWHNVYFGAGPYLDALGELETVDDAYGLDSGRSIVNYFLANAQTWRGETAKTVKAELKRRLKGGR